LTAAFSCATSAAYFFARVSAFEAFRTLLFAFFLQIFFVFLSPALCCDHMPTWYVEIYFFLLFMVVVVAFDLSVISTRQANSHLRSAHFLTDFPTLSMTHVTTFKFLLAGVITHMLVLSWIITHVTLYALLM
jgi:hypothetical protein